MNELDAAGIHEPLLRESYLRCKKLNSEYGKTYFLATLLLPKSKRPFVHALYGFARYSDEIVDDLSPKFTSDEKAVRLREWSKTILHDLQVGMSEDPIGRALIDTVVKFDIPIEYFVAFLESMKMDLLKENYENFTELMTYIHGSACVIGLEMIPILGGRSAEAYLAAEKLGTAFQLANFIRDIDEDLMRGRIYLPQDEMRAFKVSNEMLHAKTMTPEITALLKFQIARIKNLQKEAEKGIPYLARESQPCIRAASELYCGIVDEIESIDYDIFSTRVRTSHWRKLFVASKALLNTLPYRMRRTL